MRASCLLMYPVDDVVGAGEGDGVVVVEAESMLISSQASLVHPKISLWMRRCCVLLVLLLVEEQDFLLLLEGEEVLDLLMAVRSLFCVERSHFVRRQTFLALRPSPAMAARAWRMRGFSILFERGGKVVYERRGIR
jgi:hypothetical protein